MNLLSWLTIVARASSLIYGFFYGDNAGSSNFPLSLLTDNNNSSRAQNSSSDRKFITNYSDLDFSKILTGCLPTRSFWDEFVDRLGDYGEEIVIRDIIRIATDQTNFTRAVDTISALGGMVAIAAQHLADSYAMDTKADDFGLDPPPNVILSRSWNVTSQVTAVFVGVYGTLFDIYNIWTNGICLLQGNCGRYEALDLTGSVICIMADVVSFTCPQTSSFFAWLETYYALFVFYVEKVLNSLGIPGNSSNTTNSDNNTGKNSANLYSHRLSEISTLPVIDPKIEKIFQFLLKKFKNLPI